MIANVTIRNETDCKAIILYLLNKERERLEMTVAPQITAHSGCEGTERDSLESIKIAIDLGVDAVEVDVRKSPDGTLRISHDRKASSAMYEQVPRLEEVFAMLRSTRLSVNCDLKEREHLYDVLALALKYGFGPDRLILTGSVSPEQLAYDGDIRFRASVHMNIEELFKYLYLQAEGRSIADFPRLMVEPWAFTRQYMSDLGSHLTQVIAFVNALDIDTINFPYHGLTEECCRTLEKAGVAVSVWTMDDEASLDAILGYSVSNLRNITTRQVRMVQDRMSAIFEKNRTAL